MHDRRRRHHDLLRADGTGRQKRAVDHEMGGISEQDLVLPRRRLALGAVRDDDGPPASAHHRLELRGRREGRPAAARKTRLGDAVA